MKENKTTDTVLLIILIVTLWALMCFLSYSSGADKVAMTVCVYAGFSSGTYRNGEVICNQDVYLYLGELDVKINKEGE